MPDPASPSRSLCILVADDEPMIALALSRLLEARGHTVLVANNADQACELLATHSVDAALVDQNMPGSGLTVLHYLFDQPGGFDGLAVLMTGGADGGEIDQISGEVQRLQKPFRFGGVGEMIENFWRDRRDR